MAIVGVLPIHAQALRRPTSSIIRSVSRDARRLFQNSFYGLWPATVKSFLAVAP